MGTPQSKLLEAETVCLPGAIVMGGSSVVSMDSGTVLRAVVFCVVVIRVVDLVVDTVVDWVVCIVVLVVTGWRVVEVLVGFTVLVWKINDNINSSSC
jgi:hypothetical protein